MSHRLMKLYPHIHVRPVPTRKSLCVVTCSKCNWTSYVRHKNALARTSIAWGRGVSHSKLEHPVAQTMLTGIQ
jgi:hypothetical protein